MVNQLRAKLGVVGAAAAMALAYTGSANAFVVSNCYVPGASTACGANINTLTQGWDGAGLGAFNLGYYIGNPSQPNYGIPAGLTFAAVEQAFLNAAATWSSVVQVSFTKLGDASAGSNAGQFANNSVDFYFHTTAPEGAALNFDGAWNPGTGAGGVFAHAWGPVDIMTESSAGNMHFDAAENWVTSGAAIGTNSATIDLESVILHELGHALGLGHEDGFGSGLVAPVMQSLYWGEHRSLEADDIAGIRSLYACAGAGCPGPGPGGTAPEPGTLLLVALGLLAGRSLSRRQARPKGAHTVD